MQILLWSYSGNRDIHVIQDPYFQGCSYGCPNANEVTLKDMIKIASISSNPESRGIFFGTHCI